MNKSFRFTAISAVLLTLITLSACKKNAEQAQAPALPMSVVQVLKTDLPWNIEYPAQVSGSLEIQIRAQVGGILQARLYDEGSYVKQGTQLFQIDQKEYRVAFERAQGSLAQATAEENRAKRDFERMKKLRADNAVSQKDYDDALSAYEAAQAQVQVAKAGLNDAKINLEYTRVTAPISGITGKEAQSVGSLVSPAGGSGLLTTMVQINPLYINFSMPSSQFYKLASGYMSGQIVLDAKGKQPIYVEAVTPTGQVYPEKGRVVFFDSTEDVQTSSIAIKAEFPNPNNQRLLMPGQFVRVRLIGATYKEAVLIPSSAVLSTSAGNMVYVVGADNVLQNKIVKAELQDDMFIVTEGLSGGEMVVSEGLIKARPGQKITPQVKEFKLKVQSEALPPASKKPSGEFALDQTIKGAEAPDVQDIRTQGQKANDVRTDDVAGIISSSGSKR